MELDDLDRGILRLLQGDARLSFRQLAQQLGSTTPTISARVKALEALGILRGYHADVDPAVLERRAATPSSEVACHHCHGPIAGTPVRRRVGERAHIFCCRTCLGAFVKRYGRLAGA